MKNRLAFIIVITVVSYIALNFFYIRGQKVSFNNSKDQTTVIASSASDSITKEDHETAKQDAHFLQAESKIDGKSFNLKDLQDLVNSLKKPIPPAKPFDDEKDWHDYYENLFNSNNAKVVSLINSSRQVVGIEVWSETLCAKGYFQFCFRISNIFSLFPEGSNMDELKPKDEKKFDKMTTNLLRMCKSYSPAACLNLSFFPNLLADKLSREFTSFIDNQCNSDGWKSACEAQIDVIGRTGNKELALDMAMDRCKKLDQCEQAGYLNIGVDDERAEYFLFGACEKDPSKCQIFIMNFPKSKRISKAEDIMAETCEIKKHLGYSPCISLASYQLFLKRKREAAEILKINCDAGNFYACGNLAALEIRLGNFDSAVAIIKKECSKTDAPSVFSPRICNMARENNNHQEILKSLSHYDLKDTGTWDVNY